ncbi:putative carbohydrate esterase family 16 protein [Mycena sanguinolenta]|uniref:Putative carbohydrate esterase family 16 protein n=1 Tax=Mycena sanguinolenta TaxID=230812 RepID=A0A8H7CHJ9_9AGAR|nr:putative carbohydrate esterase family 16 protein [Mycena sanguinolenta]
MATFDSLPIEIHDKIFEEIISSTLPSQDYEQDMEEERVQLKDVPYVGYGEGRCVKWQKTQTPHPADALLLVNRRVRAEAKVVWKRVAHTLPCYADIMFAAEAELCPTFLSVYTDATHFDVVHAQFRVVGLPDPAIFSRPRGHRSAIWAAYDGNMPPVTWMFFDLLHRFLKAGPWLAQTETVDRHITIQRLEIHVLSPADPSLLPPEGVFQSWHRARTRRSTQRTERGEDLRQMQMRPEWLCDWIVANIRRLTGMDYTTMEYGGIFYERIGEIAVLVDGEERTVFKLGEMLSELPKGDPWGFSIREMRKEWFGKWKKSTLKERMEAGLPVIDSSE